MPDKTQKPKSKAKAEAVPRRVRVFVSSTVYGYEDLLESIYALLETMEYEVVMSHKGTVPVDPSKSAFDSCLQTVRDSDLFLGVILPSYGSGKEEEGGFSITHREALLAIELDMPRWFLVHEHVAVARQLLEPYRDETVTDRFELKPGIKFKRTPILSNLRVLDLYEAAMRHDIKEVKNRKGNWVQTFGADEDARLFVNAQFRRHRQLLEKHLPKLGHEKAMRARITAIKGGQP